MSLSSDALLVDRVLESVRTGNGFLQWLAKHQPDLMAELPKIIQRVRSAQKMERWRGGLARPDQLLPGTPGSFSDRTDWRTWLVMGGRGGGKAGAPLRR